MTPTQADVDRWAALVARGYAVTCAIPLSPTDELNLATYLGGPLVDCLMLAIPPRDWGPHHVNPALDCWEAAGGRPRPACGPAS